MRISSKISLNTSWDAPNELIGEESEPSSSNKDQARHPDFFLVFWLSRKFFTEIKDVLNSMNKGLIFGFPVRRKKTPPSNIPNLLKRERKPMNKKNSSYLFFWRHNHEILPSFSSRFSTQWTRAWSSCFPSDSWSSTRLLSLSDYRFFPFFLFKGQRVEGQSHDDQKEVVLVTTLACQDWRWITERRRRRELKSANKRRASAEAKGSRSTTMSSIPERKRSSMSTQWTRAWSFSLRRFHQRLLLTGKWSPYT